MIIRHIRLRARWNIVFTLVLAVTSGTAASLYAQPTVTFPTPLGPGIQIPFNSGQSPGEAPVDYGNSKSNFGWTYDGWAGNAINGNNALQRMVPTLQGPGALTAMGEANDWVFHFEFDYPSSSAIGSDFFMYAKAEPGYAGTDPGNSREQRMFALTYNSSDTWDFRVGNADGSGWNTAVSGLTRDGWTDVDIHYDANAGNLNFWWDGVLAGTAAPGHGRFDVDLIQLDEISGGGTTSVRNFRLGHVIPEPGSLALLGLGAMGWVLALRRRRQ